MPCVQGGAVFTTLCKSLHSLQMAFGGRTVLGAFASRSLVHMASDVNKPSKQLTVSITASDTIQEGTFIKHGLGKFE